MKSQEKIPQICFKSKILIEDLMDDFDFIKCYDSVKTSKRIRDFKNEAEEALLRVVEILEDSKITDEERSKLYPIIRINSFQANGWWCKKEGIKIGLIFILEENNNYV